MGPPGATSIADARVVHLPFPQDDGSLTPYTFQLGYPLMMLVYDTLLWRDAEGVPKPWLARSVDTSTDGRRITVRLANGVRWQDGTPLTADDVVFTFKYISDHPHPRFTAELDAIAGTSAIDAATVAITLRQPSPGFDDQPLADVPILPAHLWRDLPAGQRAPAGLPVGSGPYRLVDYRPGSGYRFEANADYFRGAPAVGTLDVPIIGDGDGIFARFAVGALDMVPFSLPRDTAGALDRPGVQIVRGPSYVGTSVAFNLRRPPFDRPELRQALARAIDLRQLTTTVGDATAADRGYLHPESRWALPGPVASYDDAEARAAIAALKPPAVDLLVADNDPVRMAAAHEVALAWSHAGLSVQAKPMPRADLGHALGEDGSDPSFQAAITVIPALASDDPDFLGRLFESGSAATGLNVSGYSNKAFDGAALAVRSTLEPEARRAAVTQTLQLLAADVPVIPLFFSTGVYAYRPAAFDGWVFVKGSGILDKRSFVEPHSPTSAPSAATTGPAPARVVRHRGVDPAIGVVAALLAIVLIGGVAVAARRR